MSIERRSNRSRAVLAVVVIGSTALGASVGPILDRFIGGDKERVASDNNPAQVGFESRALKMFRVDVRQDNAAHIALGTCLASPLGKGLWQVTANPGVMISPIESESRFIVSDPTLKDVRRPRDNYQLSVRFSDTVAASSNTLNGPTILASRIPESSGTELTPKDYVELVPTSVRVYASGASKDSTFRRIINGKATETVPLVHTNNIVLGSSPRMSAVVDQCRKLGGLTT